MVINMNEASMHTMFLEQRNKLKITGVCDVEAFNEIEIHAIIDSTSLLIKGNALHIETLDLSSGELVITGEISALVYSESQKTNGVFKRIFS